MGQILAVSGAEPMPTLERSSLQPPDRDALTATPEDGERRCRSRAPREITA
jgi:hypothetical protein